MAEEFANDALAEVTGGSGDEDGAGSQEVLFSVGLWPTAAEPGASGPGRHLPVTLPPGPAAGTTGKPPAGTQHPPSFLTFTWGGNIQL